MPDPVLAARDVSVAYGSGESRVAALTGVSVEFRAGQLTLVMGPSGSGKTTLLSVLGCLLRPDGGSVWVDGVETGRLRDAERTDLRRRSIGFVFQAFRLFRTLDVFENVMIAADIRGARNRNTRDRARRLLEEFGLAARLGVRPGALSGGERQRVALARALLPDPAILLADEPTGSLDTASGEQTMTLLRSLAEVQGRTVAVVSHDSRWRRIACRTVLLQDGRLIEHKEP